MHTDVSQGYLKCDKTSIYVLAYDCNCKLIQSLMQFALQFLMYDLSESISSYGSLTIFL